MPRGPRAEPPSGRLGDPREGGGVEGSKIAIYIASAGRWSAADRRYRSRRNTIGESDRWDAAISRGKGHGGQWNNLSHSRGGSGAMCAARTMNAVENRVLKPFSEHFLDL